MENTTARIGMSTTRGASALDTALPHCYIHRHGGVAKLVIALACQAGGRGFKSRRSRHFLQIGFWAAIGDRPFKVRSRFARRRGEPPEIAEIRPVYFAFGPSRPKFRHTQSL